MRIDIQQDAIELRQHNYPDVKEQLDAMWKLLDAIIDTLTPAQQAALDGDAETLRAQIKAVKAKFPKP